MLLTAGCGGSGADYALSNGEYGFGLTQDQMGLSYEVPVARPNISVDCLGYEPDGRKIAIFRGTSLPDVYTIRDAESREVVYMGSVKKRSNEADEREYNSYGDFSDFSTPGNYYIQMDVYGESYPFIIHDNLYYSLFNRACESLYALRDGEDGWQMEGEGEERQEAACLSVYQLLLSYEMFPEVYTDEMGIAESGNGIPDLLDECGYEARWLIRQAEAGLDGGTARGYLASVLAKYAYLTKNMDTAFAQECLASAEEAWKKVEKDLSVPDDVLAMAAAELYRVTGGRQYRGLAEQYLEQIAGKEGQLTDAEFFAGITYMNTKSKVDVGLCNAMMGKMMEETERVTELSREDAFYVHRQEGEDGVAFVLTQALRICVINHIITNHEYGTLIENHFHYVMGCNPDSVCHVSCWEGQALQTADIIKDPLQNSAYIFILSGLLSRE